MHILMSTREKFPQQFSLWAHFHLRMLCEWHPATIFRGWKPLPQGYAFKMRIAEISPDLFPFTPM